MLEEILQILDNVTYWDTCPDNYRTSIENFLKSEECKQLKLYHSSLQLPCKDAVKIEIKNRIEDIKQSSSMCENTQIHFGYRLGFEECYEWLRK